MSASPVKRILDRAISVSREELESVRIVRGRPLSDVIEMLGVLKPKVVNISERGNETGFYIPARPMHEVPPLMHLAQPLSLEVWATFYDINGIPVYYVVEPPIDDVGLKLYVFLRQRVGEIAATSPQELLSLARETLQDLGVDPKLAFAEETVKAAIYYTFRDMLGYGPLEVPMEDGYVEEVSWFSYDGPVEVVDKKVTEAYPNSEFIPTNIFFEPGLPDIERKFTMTQIIRAVSSRGRAGLTTAKPLVEARIPDPSGRGFHRLAAHLDITSRSPAITIRKFPLRKLSVTELISFGTLSSFEAAYLIWQLLNRGFILIVGGMASGKSVYSKGLLLVKTKGGVTLMTFEKLWDVLAKEHGVKRVHEMEFIESPDIEVLALSEAGVMWARPKYLIRHRYKGKMYRVRTKTGREVIVTPDHSLLVWRVGGGGDRFSIKVVPVKPEEIVEKQDYLPYLRRLPLEGAGVEGKAAVPKFGYILGFYVAEGYVNGAALELHQSEGGVLHHVLSYLDELGIEYRVTPDKQKPHMKYISLYDSGLRQYAKTAGRKAREKRVPDVFWGMDEEWRAAFLAGVIDGDGSVHVGRRTIEVATASRELAYGLLYAFASLGVHAYVREKRVKKYPDRVYYRVFVPVGINRVGLSRVAKYLSGEKRALIEEAMGGSANHHSETDVMPVGVAYAIGSLVKRRVHGGDLRLNLELRSYRYKGENPSLYRAEKLLGGRLYDFIPWGVGFDRVESVEQVEYDGFVYDIEVPGVQNFEAGGIFVHNTTLLQALISSLPTSYKVITVEDTPELSTPAHNWHPLYVRRAPRESELEDVDFSRLVIHSLRHRGTIVTLGEVRGAEMADLIQAAASGHGAICLPPSTPILARRAKGEEAVVTIRELVERFSRGEEWEVYSLSLERGVFEWRPVTAAVRVKTGMWVKVRTESGRRLKMTPDHRVPVLRGAGRVDVISAGDIRIGDMIPVAGRVPRGGAVRHFLYQGVYLPLSADMGRLLGAALLGNAGGRHYLIPVEYRGVLDSLPFKIPYEERGGMLKIRSRRFKGLVDAMLEAVKASPLKLPHHFVRGLGEVLTGRRVALGDAGLAYAVHYALKTEGYDSVVDEESGAIAVLGRREEPLFFERVVSVETEQVLGEEAYDIEVEGNHTFTASSSIVTGNCTFHAHDPESVLARITSPPINAAPESLKLITSIVHIARTKTLARGREESVRRVIRIFEIKDVKGREVESVEVFRWNPLADVHVPQLSDGGLVELWRRSATLRAFGREIYVDEAPKALVEIYVLASFLDYLVKNKVFDIKEVLFRMTALYLKLGEYVDKLWRQKYRGMLMPLMKET